MATEQNTVVLELDAPEVPEVEHQNAGWLTREELESRYAIKTAAFYDRRKRLGIKPVKQGGKTVYSPAQVEQLDGLHAHIKEQGTMEGFLGGELATVEAAEVEQAAQEVEVHEAPDEFAQLIRAAQEHAAGALIAKYQISATIQEQPELLPPELRSQVNQAKAAAAPKSQSPQEVAAGMVREYQSRQQAQAHPAQAQTEPANGEVSPSVLATVKV